MLITSRTPLRVSFFGGGTDYPEYFEHYPGAVVGMAVNKYIYVSALRLGGLIDYKYRVSYSRLETVQSASDIQHPVVRSVLSHFEVDDAIDISVMADLPARSGLGSSSSFTVGLINLVAALKSMALTRLDLSKTAIHVERNLLHENVGIQDQLHAAFGGINRFDFFQNRVSIAPVQMTTACQRRLMSSMVLVYTGMQRFASATLNEQITATRERKIDKELSHLLELTSQAVKVLESDDPERMLADFGAMLHDGWMTKKQLSARVSTPAIDALYDAALAAGATGGKLCGAGGGGFLLMLVPPERLERFTETLHGHVVIPICLDTHGSKILAGSSHMGF